MRRTAARNMYVIFNFLLCTHALLQATINTHYITAHDGVRAIQCFIQSMPKKKDCPILTKGFKFPYERSLVDTYYPYSI